MPQPDSFTGPHKDHVITANLRTVTVTKDDKTVYSRTLPDGKTACAMTNFQCGKVVVDAIR